MVPDRSLLVSSETMRGYIEDQRSVGTCGMVAQTVGDGMQEGVGGPNEESTLNEKVCVSTISR